MANIKIAELQSHLFKKLSDTDCITIVGGSQASNTLKLGKTLLAGAESLLKSAEIT